jgi:uncharacterized protein YxjI
MFDRRTYIVRERVAFMKLSDTYDLLDAESGAAVGVAQERISGTVKALRMFLGKRLLPTRVVVAAYEGGPAQLTIERGPFLFVADVRVLDETGQLIGRLRSKLFTIGGGMVVQTPEGEEVGRVNGDFIGWNFAFVTGGRTVGTITKKWAGIGKELFTNADTYAIAIETERPSRTLAALVLAAGIAIDTVFKEKQR